MKIITGSIFTGLLVAAALYVQSGGFLSLFGIVPDVLLIVLIASAVRREHWVSLACVLSGLLAYAFFYTPFWMPEYAVLSGIVAVARAVPRLSGIASADFFILLAGGIILMHAAPLLIGASSFSLSSAGGDFIYTMCLGAVVWFITIRYGKKSYSV